MESLIATARVARAKKEAADGVLAEIGATTSELINSAYDYVILERELPACRNGRPRSGESFARFLSESTCAVDWGALPEGADYDEMLRSGKRADYESLA